jgi:hypothetical protein
MDPDALHDRHAPGLDDVRSEVYPLPGPTTPFADTEHGEAIYL